MAFRTEDVPESSSWDDWKIYKDIGVDRLLELLADVPKHYRVHCLAPSQNIVIVGPEEDGFPLMGYIDIADEELKMYER